MMWPRALVQACARLPWPAASLDLAAIGQLTFQAPDPERFPALALARSALERGSGAPAALNAANETAVAAFLDRKIGFLDIASTVAETLERMDRTGDLATGSGDDTVEIAMILDRMTRQVASEVLSRVGGHS